MTTPTDAKADARVDSLAETKKADEEALAARTDADQEYLKRSLPTPITVTGPDGIERIVQNDTGEYVHPESDPDPVEVERLANIEKAREQARKDREAELAGNTSSTTSASTSADTGAGKATTSSSASTGSGSSSSTTSNTGSGS